MTIESAFGQLSVRFNRAIDDIAGSQTESAITRLLITIGANTAPMIPIDTSNLINSEFRSVNRQSPGWVGRLGYGASYALYVHEASGKTAGQPRSNGNDVYWSPNGEPKFLEKGVDKTVKEDFEGILRSSYER